VRSFDAGEAPHRSTSSLGVIVHLRAFTVWICLFCTLAACHPNDRRPIVRVAVFEDHVSVDGVRSDLPIEQAVHARTQSRNVSVFFITSQALSEARRNELRRSIDQIPRSAEIGIRRVEFPCSTGKPVAISTSTTAIATAKEAWKSIYVKASQRSEFSPETIANSEPYVATLENGVWHVVGTLPRGTIGGTPEASICAVDGSVLDTSHSQ
jgi:NTF2 fold immunity protein